MAKPLGSRIIDMIQSVIPSVSSTTNDNLEDIEDTMVDLCIDCSDPCSTHQVYPYLRINHTLPLQGTVKPYYKHVLISTGKSDWQSHIEDENESLAAQLEKVMKGSNKGTKIKIKDKKNKDKNKAIDSAPKKPKILITNSSRKNDDDDDSSFSEGNDVLLFLDNILIRRVSPKHAAEFYNQFLRKGESNSSLSSAPVTFTVEPIPYKGVILICSHMRRDKRCGVTGPLLKDEFDKVLKKKGLDIECRAGNNDGIAVYMSSHIGGHKVAGNVIVYREGQGIWYGRVTPCHVESIVEKTVVEGKIIRELYRGSIMSDNVPSENGASEVVELKQ